MSLDNIIPQYNLGNEILPLQQQQQQLPIDNHSQQEQTQVKIIKNTEQKDRILFYSLLFLVIITVILVIEIFLLQNTSRGSTIMLICGYIGVALSVACIGMFILWLNSKRITLSSETILNFVWSILLGFSLIGIIAVITMIYIPSHEDIFYLFGKLSLGIRILLGILSITLIFLFLLVLEIIIVNCFPF